MFYTRPQNLNFSSMYREPQPGADQGLGEIFSAYDKAANQSEVFGGDNMSRAYDLHNAKAKDLTGVDLPNPAKRRRNYFLSLDEQNRYVGDFRAYRDDGGAASAASFWEQWQEKEYRRQLSDLVAKYPQYKADLLPEQSFVDKGYALGRADEEDAARLYEKSGGGIGPWMASVMGSIWSAHDDPVTYLTAPIGFSGRVGTGLKGIAVGVLKAGTANAAVEASLQPAVQSYRARAGLSYGLSEAALAVGSSFAFAGALDAGVRGIARTLRAGLGYQPVVKDGVVVSYRKIDDRGAVVSEIPAETVSKAETDEDPAAIRQIAEATGLADREPVVRATLDAMDANEVMLRKPVETVPDVSHQGAVTQSLRHVADPVTEPLPVVRDGAGVPELRNAEWEISEARSDLQAVAQAAQQLAAQEARYINRMKAGGSEKTPEELSQEIRSKQVEQRAQLEAATATINAKIADLTAKYEDMSRVLMSEDLIEAVASGTVRREVADLVAEFVPDHDMHLRMAKDLTERKPQSPDEARRMVHELINSPDYRPRREPDAPAPGMKTRALDDPYGPDAKAQVDQLERQMAEELGIAAPEKGNGGQTPERGGVGARTEAAPREAFRDPETGDALEASDVESIVDMWRYVRETRKKKPETLTAYIMRMGRIKDESGELTNILGGKSRHLISGKGMTLDDAALVAHQDGFFTDRPDVATLLDAIDNDVRGNHLFRDADFNAAEDWRVAQDMEADLGRFGVDTARTEDEVRAYFRNEDAGAEGAGRGQENSGGTGPEAAVRTYADAKAELIRRVESGDYNEDEFYRLKALVESEIADVVARLPERTNVRVTMLPEGAEGVFDNRGIMISMLALDPAAIIRHEEIHALKASGLFSDAEWGLLVKKAKESGISDEKFLEGRKSIREAYPEIYGERFANDAQGLENKIIEESVAYMVQRRAEGSDFGPEANGLIDRIAQFFERLRNALSGFGFRTVDDVLKAIEAGDVARRGSADGMGGEAMFALRTDTDTGRSMRRELDALGYYSGALEAAKNLRQAKGTPEQMLAMLKKEGAKDAEIAATGLQQFLAGKASVTKDEIVQFVEGNRVGLKGAEYGNVLALAKQLQDIFVRDGRSEAQAIDLTKRIFDGKNTPEQLTYNPEARRIADQIRPPSKWSAYSLDPSNPTYRETVLHVPETRVAEIDARLGVINDEINSLSGGKDIPQGDMPRFRELRAEAKTLSDERANLKRGNFQSGHFSEPNVTGHMMTSMVKHEGKPTYLIDQIQSDWGQKLRDGGVRDEAKIAEWKKRLDARLRLYENTVAKDINPLFEESGLVPPKMANHAIADIRRAARDFDESGNSEAAGRFREQERRLLSMQQPIEMIGAELRTLEASTPGNPLVNTTDQWVNTTLRRAITQAVEADAHAIAIPSGKTVLSYNPGDEHGMEGFYNDIVPKNLRKILQRLDPETPAPAKPDKLETPGKGPAGNGFSVFTLTDRAKAAVKAEGLPMFALRNAKGQKKLGADERAANIKADLDDIEARFQAAGGDERAKLQAKRAAFLNAKAEEALLDDVMSYVDESGQSDPALGLLYAVENFGEAPIRDMATLREDIQNEGMRRIDAFLWRMRKGPISGDLRRRYPSVKTTMENVILELGKKSTNDATAKEIAEGIQDAFEWQRQRFNANGGDIGKLDSYILPQHHNAEAIIGKYDAWSKYLMDPRNEAVVYDHETGQPVSREKMQKIVKDAYFNITTNGAYSREPGARMGKGALYKRRADHRVIHFATPEAWMRYQREWGGADFYTSIVGHLSSMSRDIAAMERFGANPEHVFERVRNTILSQAQKATSVQSMYDELKGMTDALVQQFKSIPTRYEQIMADIGRVHGELDAVRGKSSPQIHGRSKRSKDKIEALQMKLEQLHEELKAEINAPSGLTPQQTAMREKIASHMDEMAALDRFPRMSRDPVARAGRVLTRAEEMFKSQMGASSVPSDAILASAMQGWRNITASALLPLASISSIADHNQQIQARLMVRMPVARHFTSFFKAFSPASRRDALALNLGLDQARAALEIQARQLGRLNTSGWTGFIVDRTHAYSLMSPMTQAQKIGFGTDFMYWMAGLQKSAFKELHPQEQAFLQRNRFTPGEWEALRKVQPEMVRGVPQLSRRSIAEQAGEDLAEKYMLMLLHQRRRAILEPTTRGQTWWVGNPTPGTLRGEAALSIRMLKSFPTTYTMTILGDAYRAWMQRRWMDVGTYAITIAFTGALFGALAIQLKNIFSGRDPEDMTEPRFWGRAFAQSGGFGIAGDYIASATGRNGQGIYGTLLGPQFGQVASVVDLTAGSLMQYAQDEKIPWRRKFSKVAKAHTPGVVPFYLRTAVDRMFIEKLQQQIDPDFGDYARQQMKNRKRIFGNDYFWPIGQSSPSRNPDMSAAFGGQ